MLGRIALIAVCGSALALAQGGRGGGGRGSGMDTAPRGSFGPIDKADRIHDALKLSKEQGKELRAIFDDAQKEAAPLNSEIAKARTAIGEAVAAGKSQDEIARAVNEEAALESSMTVIELKAFSKFALQLEPDQQQRVGFLFQMMRGMFSGKNWNSD